MIRTQIYLTEEQKRALEELSIREGVSAAALIRQALERFLREEQGEREREGLREALEETFGLWQDREGLEAQEFVRGLRQEWEGRGARRARSI